MKNIHGIIILDKPGGMTSQQAVTKVRRILGIRKAGHTGTLDPMATGVLLVCLNEATKLASFLTAMDKQYAAGLKLGERTDTFDAEGSVTERRDISHISREGLQRVLQEFSGNIRQLPPMYSAVKIAGQRLYTLARKGIDVERPEREVYVSEITLTGMALPHADFTVTCSKGTYVRTLCDDIGQRLGTGAHLSSLRRLRVGDCPVGDAVTFEELMELAVREAGQHNAPHEGAANGSDMHQSLFRALEQKKYFIPPDKAVSFLDEVVLEKGDAEKVKQGQQITLHRGTDISEKRLVRLKDNEGFLFGIGLVSGGRIKMERLLKLQV